MFVPLQTLFGREKCRKWSVSSVGLERLLDRQEVTSSNLVQITKRGEVRLRLFYGEGLLAQLVQSASFTRKRSTVRICHRPHRSPWNRGFFSCRAFRQRGAFCQLLHVGSEEFWFGQLSFPDFGWRFLTDTVVCWCTGKDDNFLTSLTVFLKELTTAWTPFLTHLWTLC